MIPDIWLNHFLTLSLFFIQNSGKVSKSKKRKHEKMKLHSTWYLFAAAAAFFISLKNEIRKLHLTLSLSLSLSTCRMSHLTWVDHKVLLCIFSHYLPPQAFTLEFKKLLESLQLLCYVMTHESVVMNLEKVFFI